MASDSRWDSRFHSRLDSPSIKQSGQNNTVESGGDNGYTALCAHLNEPSQEEINFGNILRAASSLPQLQPYHLIPDKTIGIGSSFRVNREIVTKTDFSAHFVAVKHVLIRDRSPINLRRTYRAVLREARVLTHPPLRGHVGIVRALAYGWTDSPSCSWDPYFVVEYSDYGTLTAFLQKIRPPLNEGLDLVYDVALGIEALHSNQFIHGDFKPQNVLVFDTQDDTADRIPQIAKLADFGCAVSEEEILEGAFRPLGTTRYNAPEIENLAPRLSKSKSSMFELLVKSDVYSFGLAAWEVVKNGQSYLEKSWLLPGETEHELRQRIDGSFEGGLRHRAIEYFETLKTGAKPKADPALNILQEAIEMSLKDNPQGRPTMAHLVQHFNQTKIEKRQSHSHRTQMIAFSDSDLTSQERFGKFYRAPADKCIESRLRGLSTPAKFFQPKISPEVTEKSRQTSEWIVAHKRGMLTLPTPKAYLRKSFNFLETPMAALNRPPWEIQTLVAKEFHSRAHVSKDISEQGAALLQLSICYYIGFGVEQDSAQSITCLSKASQSNAVAAAIERRVIETIVDENVPLLEKINQVLLQKPANEDSKGHLLTALGEPFHDRVRIFQQRVGNKITEIVRNNQDAFAAPVLHSMPPSVKDQVANDHLFRALLTEPGSSLDKYFETNSYLPTKLLSDALTATCRFGKYNAAVALISHMQSFEPQVGAPTPLHWLISFDPDDAVFLVGLLIQGSPTLGLTKGICASLIDEFHDESIFFPEHCMELFGTPLHWAVRTRNISLVQEYVKLGAKTDSVAMSMTVVDEVPMQVEYSPLELAIVFHMPEMVQCLAGCGPALHVALSGGRQILFNLTSVETQPFARYMVHGKGHRDAVEDTLQSLIDAGLDINSQDADGETPFSRALFQVGPERYIPQALLRKGAVVDDIRSTDGQTMASRIILDCANRPSEVWKLSLILPYVEDLNRPDEMGKNALHYCAITGNTSMAEILFKTGRVDIEAKDSKGRTAMALSAMFGKASMLELLLHKGANRDQVDESGDIPLFWAIRSRKLSAINILIKSGAEQCFQRSSRPYKTTILHEAIMGTSEGSRTSILKQILDEHPNLGTPSCLNAKDEAMLTPLQTAVYRGDVSAVKALIGAGADRTITNDCRNGYRVPDHVRRRLGYRPAQPTLDYLGTALQIASSFSAYCDNLGPPLFLVPLSGWEWLRIGGEVAMREYRNALQEIKILLSRP